MRRLIPYLRSIVGACLLATVPALAQSVRWDPPGGQLGFNQVSDLALVFENCEPDGAVPLPKADGLSFLGQPSVSTQRSFNFINGQASSTVTYTLTYNVRPNKRATINLPPFEVPTNKGRLRVPAAAYTVGDATVGRSGLAIDDVASARLATPAATYWAGEVIPIKFTLDVVRRYFNALVSSVDWPSAPLLIEDWSKPEVNEVMRGERRVLSTQTTRAIAREPGALKLDSASQLVNLVVGMSGFGLFQQPAIEQRQIVSNPLALTIKPLPPPPADFSKAVGRFSLVSKIVPTTAAVGEPVTWTLELSGTGNWPDIAGLPAREVSSDFQVVQPKSKRTLKDNALFEGTLSEDVVLVPAKAGAYRLGPVRFTYFDTESGSYKTLTTETVTVTITGGAAPAQTQPATNAPQFTLPPQPSDLRPSAAVAAVPPAPPGKLPRDPLPGPQRGVAPLAADTLVLACLLPSILCFLLAWLWLAIRRSRETDPQRRRREARAQLAALLADLRSANLTQTPISGLPSPVSHLLRLWQRHTATLWEISHAAPGSPLLHAHVARHTRDAATAWAKLWSEADRALHGPPAVLPSDWLLRAESALRAVRVPGWPPFSLFAPRNLLPFLGMTEGTKAEGLHVGATSAVSALVLFLSAINHQPSAFGAEPAVEAYKRGDFSAAEKDWRATLATAPNDWAARHNLGLALAQQDRWPEAAAQWTSTFLLHPRADAARWDFALGLQNAGFAPPELVGLSRGEPRYALARYASPGEWQLALVAASLLLAAAAIVWLLRAYRLCGAWARPAAIAGGVVALLLLVAATFSLKAYGQLAHPDAVLVWRPSTLRSIPTEADTSQKTSPLSAGSVAVADKAFLGWSRLVFPGGQTGWTRTEDLVPLYW